MKEMHFNYETIYTNNTFKEYALVLYHCRGKIRKTITYIFAAFFAFNGVMMVVSNSGDILTAIVMLTLAGFLFWYQLSSVTRLSKAMIKNSSDFDEYRVIKYRFFDRYFEVIDLDNETVVEYRDLYDVVMTENNVFFFTKQRQAFILGICDINDKNEFIQFIRSRMKDKLIELIIN